MLGQHSQKCPEAYRFKPGWLVHPEGGYRNGSKEATMTTPEPAEGVPASEVEAAEDEVLAPATPGAQALPTEAADEEATKGDK